MFKVTDTRLHHSQAMFVAIINGQLVVNRTSRLDNGSDTGLIGDLHTVGKREKRIRSHNGALQIEIE